MKIDFLKSIIALCFGALLAYAGYEICDYEPLKWVITIGTFVTLALPLFFALGITTEHERSSIVLSVLSWSVAAVELVSNGIFVFCDFSIPFYVIFNGILLLTYALVYNSIYRTKM